MDETQKLNKRYGLPMAICMVIGIVIGSGVFFKAEKVLTATNGNLKIGILAWAIGGCIMVVCAYTFSLMAQKYSFVNGVVDYAQYIVGSKYAYLLAWFMSTIYYPTLTSVLAWVSARYLCVIIGYDITGAECMIIAGFFLVFNFGLNCLSPKIAGVFQISTTIIKLVPLAIMGIVGTIIGLTSGLTIENFTTTTTDFISSGINSNGLLTAVVGTAFAYEGWVIATTINSELKDSKRDLPKALVIGTIIVALIYIIYYVGLSGVVKNADLMASGEAGAKLAFTTLLGNAGGTILMVFVVISCLGTLNGLMLGCVRGPYSIATRDLGLAPKTLASVDKYTNMPLNSCVIGLLLAEFWLVYFYGANLTNWFAPFRFDSSEIPIVALYAAYIPLFILFMKKEKDLPFMKRYFAPFLSICGALFMVIAAFVAHGSAMGYFFVVLAIFMIVGVICEKNTRKV
ncbi:MAG: APC family permease [Eubacteriales bacterium]|nr:APC family permease [Eubacteriales bacterium]